MSKKKNSNRRPESSRWHYWFIFSIRDVSLFRLVATSSSCVLGLFAACAIPVIGMYMAPVAEFLAPRIASFLNNTIAFGMLSCVFALVRGLVLRDEEKRARAFRGIDFWVRLALIFFVIATSALVALVVWIWRVEGTALPRPFMTLNALVMGLHLIATSWGILRYLEEIEANAEMYWSKASALFRRHWIQGSLLALTLCAFAGPEFSSGFFEIMLPHDVKYTVN